AGGVALLGGGGGAGVAAGDRAARGPAGAGGVRAAMEHTREIRVGGFRWTVAEDILSGDVERTLSLLARSASDGRSAAAPSLALRAGPDMTIALVKHAPHRTVHRVRLPAVDLHVKHYRG